MRFRGKYTSKDAGGGHGSAGSRYPWELWSEQLSRAIGEDVCLHPGTINVILDEPEVAKGRLRDRLREPLLVGKPEERDPHHHRFQEVRLYHESLSPEGVRVYLWYPEKRATGVDNRRGFVELAAERLDGLSLGDRVEIDFTTALRDEA